MPIEINAVQVLQAYVRSVIGKAEHHANDVEEIVLAVAGAVLWRNDSDKLEVRSHKGEMANMLWIQVNGRRYAISYNHKAGSIDVKQENVLGKVLASFSNATPVSDVKDFFGSL
jgi:hypothetical protein